MTMKIAILAEDNTVAGGVVTLIEAFEYCNMYWHYLKGHLSDPLFECTTISSSQRVIKCTQKVSLETRPLDKNNGFAEFDAIIVASAFINNQNALNRYLHAFQTLTNPLKEFSKTNRPIAAYCSGPLILASTGLLDYKSATCEKWVEPLLIKLYPSVKLVQGQTIVKDKQYITAGATPANLNLVLTLICEFFDKDLAQQLSKLLLAHNPRIPSTIFYNNNLEYQHNDELVQEVQQWIKDNVTKKFTLYELADYFSVSSRTLLRRFKSATGESPMGYLQNLKIEEARILLETTNKSVENIAYNLGYEDISSFRRTFTKQTSMPPRDYRRLFGQAV